LKRGKKAVKKVSFSFAAILALFIFTASVASAHPGRLDANGGHNCSSSAKAKGLCTGYHYHNADGSVRYTKPSTTVSAPKTVKPAALTVYINGAKQTYDQPPVVDNGRALVPLRGIFESLGATVNWNASSKTVTATKTGINMSLKIGSKSPVVNGKTKSIDVPAKVVNGRTLVPLRFVSETLGAGVSYDASARTIKITK
jgi:hypothetical protein